MMAEIEAALPQVTPTVTEWGMVQDSVVTNNQSRPNTEDLYIWFLRNVQIPKTEYIQFLKMIK